MKIKNEFLWAAAAAVTVFFAYFIIAIYIQTKHGIPGQPDYIANRLKLVVEMRLALIMASEAEKSAVMSVIDSESRIFAGQARSAMNELELMHKKLGKLLADGGTRDEKELFSQLSGAFNDLKAVDKVLLDLAVKNTNLKAYSLVFGPVDDLTEKMNESLARLAGKSAGSREARDAAFHALSAQVGVLRIQTLLAPHIAEENDKKMDELEIRMSNEDMLVRKHLAALGELAVTGKDPDLDSARSDYLKFGEIRKNIIVLSRENADIKSLAMSLGGKRKAFILYQGLLDALQQAILGERNEADGKTPASGAGQL